MNKIGRQDQIPEKEPVLSENAWRKFPQIASCLYGLVFGFAISATLMERWPKQQQQMAFFIWLVVLVPTCSFCWHWLFHIHPDKLKKKLDDKKAVPGRIE